MLFLERYETDRSRRFIQTPNGFVSAVGDFLVSTFLFLPLTVTRQAVTVKYEP